MARREEAVIDASVAVKWFSKEEGTETALKLREEHIAGTAILIAPDLLLYELANALRYKPGFNNEHVVRAVTDILNLQIDIITPSQELIKQSTESTYRYDTTIYDSCYLALGQLLGVEVYTSDKKFYEKASKSGILKLI